MRHRFHDARARSRAFHAARGDGHVAPRSQHAMGLSAYQPRTGALGAVGPENAGARVDEADLVRSRACCERAATVAVPASSMKSAAPSMSFVKRWRMNASSWCDVPKPET